MKTRLALLKGTYFPHRRHSPNIQSTAGNHMDNVHSGLDLACSAKKGAFMSEHGIVTQTGQGASAARRDPAPWRG